MLSERDQAWARIFIAAMAAVLFLGSLLALPARANHGQQRLEVTPEVSSRPQGTTHTLTGTLYQGDTSTTGGANNSTGPIVVDFVIESGPNAGESISCTIVVGASNCSANYQGDEGFGTDTIRASIRGHTADDAEGRYAGTSDCPVPPDPNQPNATSPGTEQGCAEGTPQPGDVPENQADSTDVVEVRWTQSISGDVCLDAEPNTDVNESGTSHVIEARATDGMKLTDTSGQFDCSGSPRSGVLLEFELTDDDPNAYFESVNGQSTNASGGGPNTVSCLTDAVGACSASVRTVSQFAEGTNAIDVEFQGDTPDDVTPTDNDETVTKDWEHAGELSDINASPETDTNPVGAQHIVTGQASDRFGNPVAGVLVSFEVNAGPHSNNDLDNDSNTPNGYFGACTTGADGRCFEAYTGVETGDDTIVVFQDDDSDFRFDAPLAGSGDQPSDEVAKTWVPQGQGTTKVRIDMETDPDNDNVNENGACDGDRQAPIDENRWDDRANPNQVGRNSAHKICAERFGPNDVPHVGPVTFRIISGPGHFTNEAGQANFGDSFTASEDAGGYNVAYLNSTRTGDTVVEASFGSIKDSGTKPWTARAETARSIALSPDGVTRESGTEHEVIATVTDKFGNPVSGATVTFSESGAGRFVQGGSTTTQTTDASGTARARTTTGNNETGQQQISASLSASQTDCELVAGVPESGDPAGNCSATVEVVWEEQQDETPPECQQQGVICGTDGDDTIVGTDGDDIIIAFGGDDTVDGQGGDDIIRLGSGNDVGVGGSGDDIIRGGSGDDSIDGNDGRDILRGGVGSDSLTGGSNNDILRGGAGRDVLRGNAGFDNLRGGRGPDTLRGGRGNDQVKGDRGHDSLYGSRGTNELNGGPGTDFCRAGSERDTFRNCES